MLHYNYSTVDLGILGLAAHKYQNYPPCQRDYCWRPSLQEKLIDSILRGLPIPPITILPNDDPIFGEIYYIVDGQQRLKTIIRYLEDKFATADKFRDEPLIRPICPNKKYSELEPYYRTYFDNYKLQIAFINGVEFNSTELVYRRMNYQLSLKLPERLYSYQSPAKIIATELEEHSVWNTIYLGKKDRKQIYQMILMAIMMETFGVYCNLTTPRVIDIAAGAIGRDIPGDVTSKICLHLDMAKNVFINSDFRGMDHFIPIYQAVMLLEDDNYDLLRSKEGCLSSWFNKHRLKTIEMQRSHSLPNLYSGLTKAGAQRKFWIENLPIIEQEEGLIQLDKQRSFNSFQRLQAWIRQNGRCSKCDKPLSTNDDGHHIIAHSIGGKTNDENCGLVHEKCHKELSLGI